MPALETAPVNSEDDAADDSAVWVHPEDPARSTIIGTDKRRGLVVYDLDGTILQQIPDGRMNNVDVLYGFDLGERRVDLVGATERIDNRIALYEVDESTGELRAIDARKIVVDGPEVYGFALMRSRTTGRSYALVATMPGLVQQWELVARSGAVDATLVRSFWVGSQIEGVVADDAHNALFIGEENLGIWRYEAEPAWLAAGLRAPPEDDDDETMEERPRELIAHVGRGQLEADVEGLTVYRVNDREGYLIASSQGDSTFAVFDRVWPHKPLFSFRIGSTATIDEVTDTDGIEACAADLGGRFPKGMFIVQDDENPGSTQNFKVVDWRDIVKVAPVRVRSSGGGSPRVSP